MLYLLLAFTPLLLLLSGYAILRRSTPDKSYWIAWCGLAATMLGDYCLAIKAAAPGTRLTTLHFRRSRF